MKAAPFAVSLIFLLSMVVVLPEARAADNDGILCEVGTATWCTACPNTGQALHQVKQLDDAFFYVTMVTDENDQAADRIDHYNIAGYPTSFFDGGHDIVFGGKSQLEPYQEAIQSARARDRPDIDLAITVDWLGEGRLDLAISVTASTTYQGRLRAYVVEPHSRWNDYDGDPYRFAFLGFAIDRDVNFNGTHIEEASWNGSEVGFPDITRDNIMIISALFNSETHTKYADPPTNTKPFDAHYVDAVAAARPPEDAAPTIVLTETPANLIGTRNVTFTWTGNDDITPEEELQYSYKLLGYDSTWSSWTHITTTQYQDVPDGIYTFKVTVRDSLGQEKTVSWAFTVDTDPPHIVSTRPSNNAKGVSAYDPAVVTFSHPMNRTTITNALTITQATNVTLVWRSGYVLSIVPQTSWQTETTYTITIGTAARRISGQSMTQPYTFSFATSSADITPPTIVQTDPAEDSEVSNTGYIYIYYSEPMDTVFFSRALKLSPRFTHSLHWNSNDTILTIMPQSLPPNTYTVTITTFASDKAGNHLQVNTSFSFHVSRPQVIGISPSDDERGVSVDTTISITFSQEMEHTSVTEALAIPFDGQIFWNENTVTITPNNNLTYNTRYNIDITGSAANIHEVTMQQPFSFSFTTEPSRPYRLTDNETPGFTMLFILIGLGAAALLTKRS